MPIDKVMEGVNGLFDVNKMFSGVEKAFKEYKSVDSGKISEDIKLYKARSADVVSGLTDILKNAPKMPNSKIVTEFANLLT